VNRIGGWRAKGEIRIDRGEAPPPTFILFQCFFCEARDNEIFLVEILISIIGRRDLQNNRFDLNSNYKFAHVPARESKNFF